ncbi:MAG: PocR ligand-binding domain-containing protein [Elusimicrobia bacterium]|nr:PocR ligand-binding domain-containing protein [Elusimicrobiota bacterium]
MSDRPSVNGSNPVDVEDDRYKTLFLGAIEGVLVADLQTKRFLYGNPAICRMLGCTEEELLRLSVMDIHPKGEVAAVLAELEAQARGEKTTVEVPCLRKNGTVFYASVSTSKITVDGRECALGFFSDITERKRAEEALRASEGAIRAKLAAILSPEGGMETLELADIFDVPALQRIMDEFYKLTNIGIGIIDIKGKVLVATGWQDICTKFHRVNPETARHCVESDTILAEGVEPGTCRTYRCKNNLRDIVTPIMVGGKHVGNLFLGQFLFEDEARDLGLFREQARRYGFDEKEYIAAYERMPRFSREQVDVVMRFYREFSDIISSMSYGKIKLARALEQSKQAEEGRRSHLRFIENLDRVNQAIQEANDLEKMMRNVLNEVFKIFDCDRVWLFYPCDPDSPSFRVPMEIAKPEYPGAKIFNVDIPMPPDMAQNLREAMGSANPVTYTAGTEKPVNKMTAEQFGVKSQMMVALYPKVGMPWVFGMHQCAYPRVWTHEEMRLMQEIGRRLADSLTVLLAHRDLQESERGMKEAQHLAQVGNWNWAAATDTITWSEEYYRLYGFDPAQRPPGYEEHLKVYTPESAARLDAAVKRNMQTGETYELDLEFVRKDGQRRWITARSETVRDDKGGIIGLRGTAQDITERRRAELEKERLNRDLIEKKKELENFLYITTHDLRSPLVNIQGFSQNLERYLVELRRLLAALALPPGPGRELEKLTSRSIPEALSYVLESSRKMDGLISSLLKVSRIGRVEMKPETVGMNALIKNIMDSLFYNLGDAGGKVSCGSLPPCRADLAAVSQIFSNLLDNAVKYRQKDRPLVVNVTGEVKGDMAFYTVADNGSGIPAADLEKVWSVFYQGGAAGTSGKKGEGIGLHMVKLIAEKNGGGITVDSKEGEGTVFSVRLPAAGEGA